MKPTSLCFHHSCFYVQAGVPPHSLAPETSGATLPASVSLPTNNVAISVPNGTVHTLSSASVAVSSLSSQNIVCTSMVVLPGASSHSVIGNSSAFVQQNFRPQPESTFIPVEPAKDLQVSLLLPFLLQLIH